MAIRRPTDEEIGGVIAAGSRGWENHEAEGEYWLEGREIEGAVPAGLVGTFLRNGPGLTVVHGTPLKHPIDGDGMVARVTFDAAGRVHLKTRFVNTKTHAAETKARRMLFPGQMGSRPPTGPGVQMSRYRDPSHTNVFYWGGKVLCCHEYALPHALDPATLETLRQDDLGGTLDLRTLSAHFRLDPRQDRLCLIAFRAGLELLKSKPQLRFYEYDRQWRMVKKTKVSVPGLNYAHDFVLTPSWYVAHMSPFINTSKAATIPIVKGVTSPGESLRHWPECPSKMVLIGRANGMEGRIIQIDTEPCHIYHFGTAHESGDTITFDACCLPPGFTMEWQYKSFLGNMADAPGRMHRYTATLDAARSSATLRRDVVRSVERRSCEFPFTNPFRSCVRATDGVEAPRYFYIMAGDEGVSLPYTSVVKHDHVTGAVTTWRSEGVVGEPVFIARAGEASAFRGDEDDGWLITQLYIPYTHKTQFVVLDAKQVEKGPVCRIHARDHIPISFHGTFTHNVFTNAPAKL